MEHGWNNVVVEPKRQFSYQLLDGNVIVQYCILMRLHLMRFAF